MFSLFVFNCFIIFLMFLVVVFLEIEKMFKIDYFNLIIFNMDIFDYFKCLIIMKNIKSVIKRMLMYLVFFNVYYYF